MRYAIVIEKTNANYSAYVPGLPGCVSQGQTEEEALGNIKDAIATYLEVVAENTAGLETRVVEVVAV